MEYSQTTYVIFCLKTVEETIMLSNYRLIESIKVNNKSITKS